MKKLKKYIHRYYSDEGRYVGSNLRDFLKNSIIMILLGVTIYLCFRNYSLSKQLTAYQPKLNPTSVVVVTKTKENNSSKVVEQETKIHTTEDSFKEIPKYSQTMMPTKILYWGTKDIKSGSSNSDLPSSSNSFKVVDSNIHSKQVNRDFPQDYYFRDFTSTDFGNFSPTKDSLVQVLLNRNNIQFTSYNKSADVYQTKDYSVDFERYKYNWTPNGLTRNKSSYLYVQPFTSVRYNVFSKSLSITPGISFKTRRLDYNLGISLNRDPRLEKNIYTDIQVEVTYKFNKWLK
jgi:hypothetical protein|nr:MAG TPA: hypothetical protein [Caudoviricetes sp.]